MLARLWSTKGAERRRGLNNHSICLATRGIQTWDFGVHSRVMQHKSLVYYLPGPQRGQTSSWRGHGTCRCWREGGQPGFLSSPPPLKSGKRTASSWGVPEAESLSSNGSIVDSRSIVLYGLSVGDVPLALSALGARYLDRSIPFSAHLFDSFSAVPVVWERKDTRW